MDSNNARGCLRWTSVSSPEESSFSPLTACITCFVQFCYKGQRNRKKSNSNIIAVTGNLYLLTLCLASERKKVHLNESSMPQLSNFQRKILATVSFFAKQILGLRQGSAWNIFGNYWTCLCLCKSWRLQRNNLRPVTHKKLASIEIICWLATYGISIRIVREQVHQESITLNLIMFQKICYYLLSFHEFWQFSIPTNNIPVETTKGIQLIKYNW